MKKILLTLCALLSIVSGAKADNLKVGNLSTNPGTTVDIPVELINTKTSYTQYQLSVVLPDGFELTKVKNGSRFSIAPGKNKRSDGSYVIMASQSVEYDDEGDPKPLKKISGSSGTLFTISISVPASASGTKTVSLKSITFSDENAVKTTMADVSFTITVQEQQKEKLQVTASPSDGEVTKGTKVTLTAKTTTGTAVSGADIYYTLNGTTPTKNSSKYTSAGIAINENCTLKAIAYKDGYETSGVLSVAYTVKKTDGITIDAINFPDANFRNYLLEQSYGKDGIVTNDEITQVKELCVDEMNISSLKGIEYFTALENLECTENQLTLLDISKNTELLWLLCDGNQIAALDVSNNSKLVVLSCSHNTLTTLDVSNNPELIVLACFNNRIKGTSMDNLINSLPFDPTNTDRAFAVFNSEDKNEGNICTKKQVVAAKAKGWIPMHWDGFEVVEYEGCNDFVKGDVNEDEKVNGTDLVALTNIILGKNPEKVSADVNGDTKVNGTDYVALANIILGKTASRRMKKAAGATGLSIEEFSIKAGETKEMIIDLTNPEDEITLVQFDLRLPAGLSLKQAGGEYDFDIAGRTTWRKHSLDANAQADGSIRFLLASSSNTVLDGKEGAIIKMTLVADNSFAGGDIKLENILMVTPDEKEKTQNSYVYTIEGNVPTSPDDPEPIVPPGWVSVISNGNLANDNVTNFFTKMYPSTEILPAVISVGVGKNGSRGIQVLSGDYSSQDWDSEFYIRLNEKIPEGAKLHIEFDYKASQPTKATTQVHCEPGVYKHWVAIGDVNFNTWWQHFSGDIDISSEMSNMQTIVFNLAGVETVTTYYFDNFVVWLKEMAPVSSSTELAIEPFAISAGETEEMIIDLTNPEDEITLVQFDLRLPAGLSLKQTGGEYDFDIAGRTTWRKHSLDANAQADGSIRFLLASSSNTVLDGKEGAIIKMTLVADNSYRDDVIRLENILLVTPDEKEIAPANVEYLPTGITDVVQDSSKRTSVFSLSGQRLTAPKKGINIVGGRKVVVK